MRNCGKIYFIASIILVMLGSMLISSTDAHVESSDKKIITVTHSAEELKLYKLINEYRLENNLSEVPLSTSLTFVAQQHCIDLHENKPDLPETCNAHSWSENGSWSSCCYTPDHKEALCMWNKPSELTNYAGYGFEIAVGSSDSIYDGYVMTAEYSIETWKKSVPHNNVILNLHVWAKSEFKAMGVGIYKGFSAVWFGRETDPEN
jgi:uncharacterized protein YkwD